MKRETMGVREQKPRKGLLWYAVFLIGFGSFVTTTVSLLAFAWDREAHSSAFEGTSQVMSSYPMQLRPLITGDDRAATGQLVYLADVLLQAGPAPKVFFVSGAQGTRILTVAQTAQVEATPGDMVNVKGTIRKTPSVAALRQQWKLSFADAKQIAQIPVYIDSEFITEVVSGTKNSER